MDIKNMILLSLVGFVGYAIKEIPRRLFNILLLKFSFGFSTTSKNRAMYGKINEWLLSLDNRIIQDNLSSQSHYQNGQQTVTMSIDYGTFHFMHKGCWCMLEKKIIESNFDINDKLTLKIIGLRHNRNKIKQNIMNMFQSIVKNDGMTTIYPLDDAWDSYDINSKCFDDIFIQDKNDIIDHLEGWKKSRDIYKKHGIVYKTGVLMYGKPGTGKSSTARAIAGYLGFDIHVINLKAYKNQEKLIRKMLSIPKKSVVLLEDIDCILKSRDSKENDGNEDLLGVVLNFLDGAMSPNECVFVATTNHIDRLDAAFIRPGRFDLKVEVGDIDKELAKDMCKRFGVSESLIANESFPINPSYLQNKILDMRFK